MRKLKSCSGMSLAELLLAVLIMLIVTSIVTAGLPVVRDAYEKTIIGANAQVLLSTTVQSLRDELGTARNVAIETKDSVDYLTYYSADTGAVSQIYLDATKNRIMLRKYADASELTGLGITVKNATDRPLVSPKAGTIELYATYDGVAYANGVVTFDNLRVWRMENGTEIVMAAVKDPADATKNKLTIRAFLAGKTDDAPEGGGEP